MVNEVFDINKVKVEFLQNVGNEYATVFSERQMELAVYVLNDFCNALASNSLVLLRVDPEELAQQYQQPQVPNMGVPQEYLQQAQQQQQQMMMQNPQQDPFIQELPPIPQQLPPMPPRQQVRQQVQELNNQYPRQAPVQMATPVQVPPQVDVDLSTEKPKSFAEKIREMRSSSKKPNRINPEDDN